MTEEKTRTAKREHLEKAFPAAYIEHGLNGRKAYKSIRPNATIGTASVESTRLLKKPKVKSAIERAMKESGMSLEVVQKVHMRNMQQRKHLPTSQRAVETAYQLHGVLGSDGDKGKGTVNIAIISK